MRESRTYGSVRGARSNARPDRDPERKGLAWMASTPIERAGTKRPARKWRRNLLESHEMRPKMPGRPTGWLRESVSIMAQATLTLGVMVGAPLKLHPSRLS